MKTRKYIPIFFKFSLFNLYSILFKAKKPTIGMKNIPVNLTPATAAREIAENIMFLFVSSLFFKIK